ncbi:MAG TPA: DUF222 domain-containing protein [Actinomycetota bacterium]|nr:DUF222 domain-containing protein [Actinomycetota bacterium]
MSELRSAVEALRSEDLVEVPEARAEEDFAELHRASELLEAERLRRLRDLERRGIHARGGHLSAASWLASRFRLTWAHARRDVHLARSVEQMPETGRAWEEGEISGSAVRVLVAARDEHPAAFAESEAQLVGGRPDPHRQRPPADRRILAAGGRAGSPPGRGRPLRERRRLHAS